MPKAERANAVAVRAVRHRWRAVLFISLSAVLIAAAFTAGTMLRPASDGGSGTANEPIPVYATVEERIVDTGFELIGRVEPAETEAIVVTQAPLQASSQPPSTAAPLRGGEASDAEAAAPLTFPTTERTVVSAAAAQRGDRIEPGDLLAEISGRPLFAWPRVAPLYRDLQVGMRGTDAAAVQQVLAETGFYEGAVDGEFGAGTLAALRAMYEAAGYEPPYISDGIAGFSWREVVAIPRNQVVIASIATPGTVLDTEHPLATVETSPAVISALATLDVADDLTTDDAVTVSSADAVPAVAVIESIGAFTTDETTGISGKQIRIDLPEGLNLEQAEAVTVRPVIEPEPTPAVPALAIRQDHAGTYVLRKLDEPDPLTAETYDRVAVDVVGQADGWVAIEDSADLAIGTEVLVSDG